MKKNLLGLMVFGLLISCATVPADLDPNKDPDFIALKEELAEYIDEQLSAEKKTMIYINKEELLYLHKASILGESKAPYNHWTNATSAGYAAAYLSAMQDFIAKYTETVAEHNAIVQEKQEEEQLAEQKALYEKNILLANGVSGDATWLNFQKKFDLMNFYAFISQDNNTMIQVKVESFVKSMEDQIKGMVFTEEQTKWFNALLYDIFELTLMAKFDESSPYSVSHVVTNRFNELMKLRAFR